MRSVRKVTTLKKPQFELGHRELRGEGSSSGKAAGEGSKAL